MALGLMLAVMPAAGAGERHKPSGAVELSGELRGAPYTIRVPENWSLVCDVLPLLGAVEDKTRPAPESSAQTKRLVLRGTVVMGGVELKN